MAKLTELDLKKQIKEKKMSNCYLFYGSEDYLKQFYTAKICSAFVTKGSETFSLRKYDGKDNTLDEVLEGALSMPFMSEYTVVTAHDFPLDSLTNDQKEQLLSFLEKIGVKSESLMSCNTICEILPFFRGLAFKISNFFVFILCYKRLFYSPYIKRNGTRCSE